MHTIKLYGNLTKYGNSFSFEVETPHEMIKALTSQIKELRKLIKDGYFRLVRGETIENGFEYSNIIDNDKYIFLDLSLGKKSQTLHLIPVLAGAKRGGLGKALIGAVLMVGAVVAAPFTGGTSIMAGISGFTFGTLGSTIFTVGASLFLSGVSSMLAPTPRGGIKSMEKVDEKPSYFLNAPMNMASENGALPIAVGEFICGSIIINASLEAVDIL